ncbi:MAG: tetratricopeptide repeat protein [bacterium]
MKRTFGLIVLLIFFSLSDLVAAQIPSGERDRALNIANRMIEEGRVDEALRMFENIYKQLPEDSIIVVTYADALYRLNRSKEAKKLISDYVNSHPGNLYLRAKAALLDFLDGDRDSFMRQIDDMIAEFRGNPKAYEFAAEMLEETKEFEKLLEVIMDGRKATGDSTLLANVAASACFETGKFMRGTREYLFMSLTRGINPESIARELRHRAGDPEARAAIIRALENARSVGEYRIISDQVLPYIYLIDGRCDLALAVMMEGISRFPELGVSIVDFSRQLEKHGCYKECAKAYEIAVKQPQLSRRIPDLLMAKAMCEKLSGNLGSAAEVYLRIAEMYPEGEVGEAARIERARSLKEIGDLESALKEATLIAKKSRSTLGKARAILLKGECLLMLGDIDGAAMAYDQVGLDWQDSLAQEAYFNLGEIALYKGDFEQAISYYNMTARQFPSEERANDAIERLMLLRQSKSEKGYPEDLKTLADAFVLERQGRIDDAEKIYTMLQGADVKPIRWESLKRLAEIARGKGEFQRSIALYNVIADSIGGDATPLAIEAIGDIYRQSGNVEMAIETYETLIIQFPGSISAKEARRKIDAIRSGAKSSS